MNDTPQTVPDFAARLHRWIDMALERGSIVRENLREDGEIYSISVTLPEVQA